MSDIDRIVQVTITRQTSTPSQPSFGSVLIAAEFLAAAVTPNYDADERVREFGKDEIATAFGTSSVVYFMASALFAQNPSLSSVKVGRKLTGGDGTETWTAALAAMELYDGDWYGLLAADHVLANQQEIADWVETNEKLYGISSPDTNVPDATGDIAEYVDTNSYDRSFVLYSPNAGLTSTDDYPAEGWIGKQFPTDPGSTTWAYKTIAGLAAYSLTTGQKNTIEGKNGNYYITVAGIDVTLFGTVGSGEFIDIIRGLDWLKSRIQVLIFTQFVNQGKVPFTDSGISVITSQLRAALQEAVDVGLLAPGFTVSAPEADNVSVTDKGTRTLPDVTWEAEPAGAIHKTQVSGVVSL